MTAVFLLFAIFAPGLVIISHPAWKVEPPQGFVVRFWLGVLFVCGLLGVLAQTVRFGLEFAHDDLSLAGDFFLTPGVYAVFLWWTLGLAQAAVAVWVSAVRHRRSAHLSPVERTAPGVLFAWFAFGVAVTIGFTGFETALFDLRARSGSPGGPPQAEGPWFLITAIAVPLVQVGLGVAQFFWFRANPTASPRSPFDDE